MVALDAPRLPGVLGRVLGPSQLGVLGGARST